jgi:hypothetical protein
MAFTRTKTHHPAQQRTRPKENPMNRVLPYAHLLGVQVKAAAKAVLPRKPAPAAKAATSIAAKPQAKARTTGAADWLKTQPMSGPAKARTTEAAVLAERERMKTICAHGLKVGSIRFASVLAFKTDMSVELAIDSLEAAKLDSAEAEKAKRFNAPPPAPVPAAISAGLQLQAMVEQIEAAASRPFPRPLPSQQPDA